MSSSSEDERPLKRSCTQSGNLRRTCEWSYKDKRALIDAVNEHGLGDVKKITELVGTKTQYETEIFINKITRTVDKKQNNPEASLHRLFSKFVRANKIPNLAYPPIALWKRVAQGIVKTRISETDNSIVLADIFDEMAKEEEEHKPCFPDLPDFRKCYTFVRDLLGNATPARLPPLESLAILMALEETMTLAGNKEMFAEENQFAQNFMGPTRFLQTKDDDDSVDPTLKGFGLKYLPLVVTPKIDDENSNDGPRSCSSNAVPKRKKIGAVSVNGKIGHESVDAMVVDSRASVQSASRLHLEKSTASTKAEISIAENPNESTDETAIVNIKNENNIDETNLEGSKNTKINSTEEPKKFTTRSGNETPAVNNEFHNAAAHEEHGTFNIDKEAKIPPLSAENEPEDEANNSDDETVGEGEELCLPTDLFRDILRHVKLKDHMNPYIAHIYMLHKERDLLGAHFDAIEKVDGGEGSN